MTQFHKRVPVSLGIHGKRKLLISGWLSLAEDSPSGQEAHH